MKMKLIPIVLLLLSISVNAQIWNGTLEKDSKGQFKGDIFLDSWKKSTLNSPDKTHFIKDYTLKMKVWDYLGEPMEMYAFQWSRNVSYTVKVGDEIRSITLEKLKAYPDLIKRFNNIRPIKVDIEISGIAGDASKENTTNYYVVGKINVPEEISPVQLHFTYTVKDVDLLIAKAGEFREPTIAGSPPTWNEFFNWSYDPPIKAKNVYFNISEANFKKLSEEEQKLRIKNIKNIWKQIKLMKLQLKIKTLEWPELEMIDIIKTYDRYRNKTKELSPQEKIEAELAKLQRTEEYTNNDEWGELPELKNPVLIITENGKSIKYLDTDIVLFDIKEGYINNLCEVYENDFSIAKAPYFSVTTDGDFNRYYLIDKDGKKLLSDKYSNIRYYNSEIQGYEHSDMKGEYFEVTHTDDVKKIKYDNRSSGNSGGGKKISISFRKTKIVYQTIYTYDVDLNLISTRTSNYKI
nr:hypothetical protein [uncultured Psychroserpens sp.]